MSVWNIVGAAFIFWIIAVVFFLGVNHLWKIDNERYDKGMDEYIRGKNEIHEEKVS